MDRNRPEPALAIHATCLVLREAGILIRGESGAGKSTLALSLLDRAGRDGSYAALVGDDRVEIEHRHGRIVARGHPALHGLIEVRGIGLMPHSALADAAVIRLVVDLVETLPRLPDAPPDPVDLLGVMIRRIMLDRSICDRGLAPGLVLDALAEKASVAPWTHLGTVSCDLDPPI
ncbi:HPr kinase/phosphatase C-terminal domain-containing protein [Methylobacterium sp. 77]|uniref:HPr kinase/phosphorylase n=1 Tax=Methylobacterium sp. 77 TaxID=1101192 RepID=UPI00035FE2A7|nr:HPr kinase/phosphatase C-terminal domain-containing protein [Methylobacterium sp. 77]